MERPNPKILRASRPLLGALAVLVAVLFCGERASASRVRRVLILDSFGREFAPYNTLVGIFKTEMARRSPDPIEFHEVPLEMARFSESHGEEPFVEYVRALFAYRRLDLVVPVGGAAVRFWQRHRDELFPSSPTLVAGIDERLLHDVTSSANQTEVSVHLDLSGTVEDILRLLPGTKRIAVVLGGSPLESFWVGEAAREWQPFTDRVHFDWWNGLSFEEIRQRAATLPSGSAIFYMMMSVDGQEAPYEDEQALSILHAEANAPIFGLFSTQVGRGTVGGRLVDVNDLGARTVRAALRILAGEPPSSIRTPPTEPTVPTYDWGELRRWKIRDAALPPGSVVLNRVPTAWEKYRWNILLTLGVIAAQALALAGLLAQRSRRRRAELESQERRLELLHATRVSTVGELTASLAHELRQPLGAILRNAEAAELLLQAARPDLDEVRAILSDIRHDDARAASVIDQLRRLLKRRDFESRELLVSELLEEVGTLVRDDAMSRGVRIETDAPAELPHVHGDRVQLIQVLLNLLVNAMDASRDIPDGGRLVSVRARQQDGIVEVAVCDSGQGIPAEQLERVFEPFHTTKANGLGLGLAISRSIIEAHGGRLWASNNPNRGATFRFTLPIGGEGQRA